MKLLFFYVTMPLLVSVTLVITKALDMQLSDLR
jgi:hypothetical protein